MASLSNAPIVRRWRDLRPDLDPTPMLVIARLARLDSLIDDVLRPPFAAAGLASGDFDLLAALRRQGPPFEATPSELALTMLLRTGTTTKRIDRLERLGYVARRPSDTDGRGRIVTLTTAGHQLVDELFGVQLDNEAAILAGLEPADRNELARLLAVLATAVETAPKVARGDPAPFGTSLTG